MMKKRWRRSAGAESLSAVRPDFFFLFLVLCYDWLQPHCHASPQVFPGRSVRRQRPIRKQTESPPSPKSAPTRDP